MKISIVVAVANDYAIGAGGGLMWQLPDDMQYFRQVTMGHHVIMGRKTWESIPPRFRPLPGRTNLVVTRQEDYEPSGAVICRSFEQGLDYAREHHESELMVIGGGELYRQAFPLADIIYLTRVKADFPEADTHFPDIEPEMWEEVMRRHHEADAKHAFAFDFITLKRK